MPLDKSALRHPSSEQIAFKHRRFVPVGVGAQANAEWARVIKRVWPINARACNEAGRRHGSSLAGTQVRIDSRDGCWRQLRTSAELRFETSAVRLRSLLPPLRSPCRP